MRSTFLALGLGLALAAPPALAADVDFSLDRGLRLRFPDADTTIHLGGRLHLDYGFFDDDLTSIDDDFDVRRGRPELEVEVGDDWKLKVEYDFAAKSRGWRAAWISWDGIPHTKLRVGNQTMPFGLEEQESSNYLPFAERSLLSALTPAYGTGLSAHTRWRLGRFSRATVSAGVYTDPFLDRDYDRHKSEHVGVAGRATVAPLARRRRVIQLGGSFDWREVRGSDHWQISRRPESALAPALVFSSLENVDSVRTLGVEAAFMYGPFLAQGEWAQAKTSDLPGSGEGDITYDGAYVQASWVVTGEIHRYSRNLATFGGVKPKSRFGALELAARWSTLDLSDFSALDGKETNYTAGVNWWVRQNLRLMFNYVNVDTDYGPLAPDDDPQVFQLRFVYFL